MVALLAATAGEEEPYVATAVDPAGRVHPGIEGPGCDREGNIYAVNFAKQQTIGKVTPDGKGEVFVTLPGKSVGNGIVFDRGADVRRRLRRPQRPADRPEDEGDHRLRPRPAMNQPNDLAIAPDGTLYASDPNWDKGTGQLWKVIDGGQGRRWSPPTWARPTASRSAPTARRCTSTRACSATSGRSRSSADGTLGEKRLLKKFPDHGFDGMRCDVDGNLYITRYGKGTVVDAVARRARSCGRSTCWARAPATSASAGRTAGRSTSPRSSTRGSCSSASRSRGWPGGAARRSESK